jgi:hypothetical protein
LSGHHGSSAALRKQLFGKATVVTLEKKYATVHWAGMKRTSPPPPPFANTAFVVVIVVAESDL